MLLMLFMLLACAAGEVDRLDAEVEVLRDQVEDLEDLVLEDEPDSADTGEPLPGEIELGFQSLGAPYWQADVVLSEEAEAAMWVTMGPEGGLVAERGWTGDCITAAWDYEGSSDQLLLVVEVAWDNGAWSCVQLVGPEVEPVTGCEVVQARGARCGG